MASSISNSSSSSSYDVVCYLVTFLETVAGLDTGNAGHDRDLDAAADVGKLVKLVLNLLVSPWDRNRP
jgi:hypothetical protein